MTNEQWRRCWASVGHRPTVDDAADFLAAEYGHPLDPSDRDALYYSLQARSHQIVSSHDAFYIEMDERLSRGARGW